MEVRKRAFAMPLTSPAYPPGPYRFRRPRVPHHHLPHRPEKLRALVPEPLEVDAPLVKYEFIRMPDSTGFGDYTEAGQVIPVSFRGRKGGYTHCMFLNDEPPIAGGRELWGFPEEARQPGAEGRDGHAGRHARLRAGARRHRHDGLQARQADLAAVQASLEAPNFLLKIIPHVDGTPRICELVEYYSRTSRSRAPGPGPARSIFTPRAGAGRGAAGARSLSAAHIVADLTLGLGKVVHDYLA